MDFRCMTLGLRIGPQQKWDRNAIWQASFRRQCARLGFTTEFLRIVPSTIFSTTAGGRFRRMCRTQRTADSTLQRSRG